MDLDNLRWILERYGQEHLLNTLPGLLSEDQAALVRDIQSIDLSILDNLNKISKPEVTLDYSEPEVMTLHILEQNRDVFRVVGMNALSSGQVGCVILAGGDGSRLGYAHPKGTFDIGVNHPLYLFERLLVPLRELAMVAKADIPVYIMVSESNAKETRLFLEEHDYFRYPKEYVHLFVQEMNPVVSLSGKILMRDSKSLLKAPNGNGGWYTSLMTAKRSNPDWYIPEWLNVVSVDNVLQKICDPVFIGATLYSGRTCAAKVVYKSDISERVGTLICKKGKTTVIEYYDLPDLVKLAVDCCWLPRYAYGVTLNYLFNTAELSTIDFDRLPYHLAHKTVTCLNPDTDSATPATVTIGAYKLETLTLDLVNLCSSCLGVQVIRDLEFAPVKQAKGIDSVESARRLLRLNGISF